MLMQLIEKRRKYNFERHLAFIDFEKTSDNIELFY
jgi:hypothetical protein